MIAPKNRDRLIREALAYAAAKLAEDEKRRGFTAESCQLASWKQLLVEECQRAD